MSKKHDENKDIRCVSRIAKIDYSNKTIQAPKSAIIGNRTWGRIDYLTHYCGWTFIWNNQVKATRVINVSEDKDIPRKKVKKEKILPKPSNKQDKRR